MTLIWYIINCGCHEPFSRGHVTRQLTSVSGRVSWTRRPAGRRCRPGPARTPPAPCSSWSTRSCRYPTPACPAPLPCSTTLTITRSARVRSHRRAIPSRGLQPPTPLARATKSGFARGWGRDATRRYVPGGSRESGATCRENRDPIALTLGASRWPSRREVRGGKKKKGKGRRPVDQYIAIAPYPESARFADPSELILQASPRAGSENARPGEVIDHRSTPGERRRSGETRPPRRKSWVPSAAWGSAATTSEDGWLRVTRGTAATRRRPTQQLFCRPMFSGRAVGRIQISAVLLWPSIESESTGVRERERETEGLARQRHPVRLAPGTRRPAGCPRMAQNVNPFSAMQNTPTKAAEEKQSLPKDNHAVSKRYAGSSPSASVASRPGPPSNPDRAILSLSLKPSPWPGTRDANRYLSHNLANLSPLSLWTLTNI